MKGRRSIAAVATMLILAACSLTQGGLQVTDAWARPADVGTNSAVYLHIRNAGGEDRLLEVRTESAQSASLHRTIIDAEGVAQMQLQSEILVPRGQTLALEPGGYHVMLMQVKSTLQSDDTISITLVFEQAGQIAIQVPIEDR